MPTRTYTIDFQNLNTQNTIAGIHALVAALNQLNLATAQAKQGLNGVGAGAAQAKEGTDSFLGSMIAMKAASLAIREIKEGIDAYGAAMKAVRDYSRETTEENLKLREILREFKFLKGEVGAGDRLPEDVLKFAAQTGMKPEESAKFLKAQADALATLSKEQKPPEAVNQAAARQMAILTARADMDPTKAGQVAGIMGMYTKLETPEQAVEQIGKIANAMGKNSIFDFRQMMPAFTGLMAEMTGAGERVDKPEDLAVIFSAVTAKNKNSASAATSVRRANRLLERLDGKEGEALKEMGVTEDMDFMQALKQVAPHITGGKGARFLAKHGFGNSSEIHDVIKLANVLPKINEGLKDNAEPGAGRQLVEENAKALAEDPALLNRQAETQRAVVEHTEGMAGERLAVARKQAENRGITAGRLIPGKDGKGVSTWGQWLSDKVTLPGHEGAREHDIDRDVMFRVEQVAKAHGVRGKVMKAGEEVGDWNDRTNTTASRGKIFEAMMGELERQAPGASKEVFDDTRVVGKMDAMVDELKGIRAGLGVGRGAAPTPTTRGMAGAAAGVARMSEPVNPARP